MRNLSAILVFFAVGIGCIRAQCAVTGRSLAAAPCFPCNPDWRAPVYFPNFDDCFSHWKCENGKLSADTCPTGQLFDFYFQGCVSDEPSNVFTTKYLLQKTC